MKTTPFAWLWVSVAALAVVSLAADRRVACKDERLILACLAPVVLGEAQEPPSVPPGGPDAKRNPVTAIRHGDLERVRRAYVHRYGDGNAVGQYEAATDESTKNMIFSGAFYRFLNAVKKADDAEPAGQGKGLQINHKRVEQSVYRSMRRPDIKEAPEVKEFFESHTANIDSLSILELTELQIRVAAALMRGPALIGIAAWYALSPEPQVREFFAATFFDSPAQHTAFIKAYKDSDEITEETRGLIRSFFWRQTTPAAVTRWGEEANAKRIVGEIVYNSWTTWPSQRRDLVDMTFGKRGTDVFGSTPGQSAPEIRQHQDQLAVASYLARNAHMLQLMLEMAP
jgi:hypothetical protein